MSLGGLIGGVVGGIGGFLIAGPTGAYIGAGVGMGIGMIVDPISADSGIGQTPTELQMTGASRGVVLTELHGAAKLNGTIIGYWNNHSKVIKAESGGKGK